MAVVQDDLTLLLQLARDKSVAGRKTLVSTISDLFSASETRLSDRERALMNDILTKLIRDFEMRVRRELSEKLASWSQAPKDLILMLANDEIEVARPILLISDVLQDADLIEVIHHRTTQHQLAISMRQELSETVTDALVEAGNVDVIRTLLDNPNSRLSEATMEYLVEESRRVDSYQEPLIQRDELSPVLARRLCLWVGAALRSYLLEHFDLDPTELDDVIEEVTKSTAPPSDQEEENPSGSVRLARQIADEGKLTPELLVQVLRQGEIALFEALLAEMSLLRLRLVQRIIYEPGGEGLVIACRGLGIAKPIFTSIFLMSRKGRPGDQRVDPGELSRVLNLFDRVKTDAAQSVLKRWQRDPEYLNAVRQIEEAQEEPVTPMIVSSQ
ncbi:DUF2336 domain-containing protein [Rhodovibrionaceae bacterium A322]